MKLDNKVDVKSSGKLVKTQTKIRIEDQGAKFIIELLSSNMYKDKISALLRELTANAVDAHMEAGKSKIPVEIDLPSLAYPKLVIRDFGNSMDEDTMRNLFAVLGESSKRDTNKSIGAFGLGKMVFAAYSGVMHVHTYIDGTETEWLCQLANGEGGVDKIGTRKSDESSGTKLIVPVVESDIPKFREKAENLFIWLDTVPKITGLAEPQKAPDAVKISKYISLKPGIHRKFEYGYNARGCTMGGLPFPIDGELRTIIEKQRKVLVGKDAGLANLFDRGSVLFHFKPGELDIVPSRDGLRNTDKTAKAFFKKATEVKRYWQESLVEELAPAESAYDVVKTLKYFFGDNVDTSHIKLLKSKNKWFKRLKKWAMTKQEECSYNSRLRDVIRTAFVRELKRKGMEDFPRNEMTVQGSGCIDEGYRLKSGAVRDYPKSEFFFIEEHYSVVYGGRPQNLKSIMRDYLSMGSRLGHQGYRLTVWYIAPEVKKLWHSFTGAPEQVIFEKPEDAPIPWEDVLAAHEQAKTLRRTWAAENRIHKPRCVVEKETSYRLVPKSGNSYSLSDMWNEDYKFDDAYTHTYVQIDGNWKVKGSEHFRTAAEEFKLDARSVTRSLHDLKVLVHGSKDIKQYEDDDKFIHFDQWLTGVLKRNINKDNLLKLRTYRANSDLDSDLRLMSEFKKGWEAIDGDYRRDVSVRPNVFALYLLLETTHIKKQSPELRAYVRAVRKYVANKGGESRIEAYYDMQHEILGKHTDTCGQSKFEIILKGTENEYVREYITGNNRYVDLTHDNVELAVIKAKQDLSKIVKTGVKLPKPKFVL